MMFVFVIANVSISRYSFWVLEFSKFICFIVCYLLSLYVKMYVNLCFHVKIAL